MIDIILTSSGDIAITADSDIIVADSVLQAIEIRLKWFLGECELYDEDTGTDWYDLVFTKDPDLELAEAEIISQILEVDEVTDADVTITVDAKSRVAIITYIATTDEETYRKEVVVCQKNTE